MTMKKILYILLMGLLSVPMYAQRFDLEQNDPERVLFGVTLGLPAPSVEVGFRVTPLLSTHARVGMFPDLSRRPNKLTLYTGDLFLRWWQDERMLQGYFVDLGLTGGYFDVRSARLFGYREVRAESAPSTGEGGRVGYRTPRIGMKGWAVGAFAGAGYSFLLGERVRLTPELGVALCPFPRYESYLQEGGDVKRVRDTSMLAFFVPRIGISLSYCY